MKIKGPEVIKDVNIGDFLTFKASDDKYKVLFCVEAYKDKSPMNFTFAATTYNSTDKPNLENLLNESFYGKGNRKEGFYEYEDEDRELIWRIHPEIKPYVLGCFGVLIFRKDFMKMRDRLEFLFNKKIVKNLPMFGDGTICPVTIENLDFFFIDNLESKMEYKNQKKFKLQAVIKQ